MPSFPEMRPRPSITLVTSQTIMGISHLEIWSYHPRMRIATLKKKIALVFVPKQDRLSRDEGFSALVQLGWPPEIITLKMCDKAKEGVMKPYAGIQSWIN